MKKIRYKYLLILLPVIGSLFLVDTGKASVYYTEYHPQDLINDESLYTEVDALTIEGEETQLLSQINFTKFSHLKEIWLMRTLLSDGKQLNLNGPINALNVNNSVVNLASIDLDDYNSISINDSYIIGDQVKNSKIHNNNPLNEDYKYDLNDVYGLQNHDSQIDTIAKEIYSQSNGAPEDIIRLVTLYVVEHIEYDFEGTYANLSTYDSIINHAKGVCAHYANFESRLLNKLGIFAMNVNGYVDPNDRANSSHAWNIVYVNKKWYSVDPTELDTERSITALKSLGLGSTGNSEPTDEQYTIWQADPLKNYMQDIDNQYFNAGHLTDFSAYKLIPESERVSKISIISKSNNSNDENSNEKTAESDNATETKVPNTGLFTSENNPATMNAILIISLLSFSSIFILFALINRIAKRIKIRNF